MIVHTEKYIRALREIKFTHIFKWPWLLFIFVLSNSMLSNIKDTLIDTMNGGGIELVPYLKGVFLPIVTILFFAIYKLLSKYFSISTSFYIIYMAFLFYFIFCSLYPPFPQTLSDNSIAVDGKFINAILIIINRYEQTTFYVLA
jgi:ATP/ADP translocase